MKITDAKLDFVNGITQCSCVFSVQGVDHLVYVNFPETQLYAAAANKGRASWENEDVEEVVSQITGLSCTI